MTNIALVIVGAVAGLWIGALFADARWRRLRRKYYWLRPPHRGER